MTTPSPAQALMEMLEVTSQFVEAAAGHRKVCEDAGFSPTAAEQMAVEFYRVLMSMSTAGVQRQP